MLPQIPKYGFLAATVATILHKTLAAGESMTSQCDAFEYYDVTRGQCRHCDTVCVDNGTRTVRSVAESRCQQLCPDYPPGPRTSGQSLPEDRAVRLTLMEGGLLGFLIAFLIVTVLAAVLLRREVYKAMKTYCTTAKAAGPLRHLFRHVDPDDDVNETSYVKLSDPFDEVEIIDRVTTV